MNHPTHGAVIAVFLAACSAGAPSSEAVSSTPKPSATATTTPSDTAEPTIDITPTPSPSVNKTLEFLKPYVDIAGYTHALVVLRLKNAGPGWAELLPGQSDFTIYGSSGAVTGTGSFIYAYPRYLKPGGVGYLWHDYVQPGRKLSDFRRVEIDGRYNAVDDPGPQFQLGHVTFRPEPYGATLIATGTIKNVSPKEIRQAVLGVIYFDKAGRVLGTTYTNLLQNFAPGAQKGFETVVGTPVDRAAVARYEIYASDLGF